MQNSPSEMRRQKVGTHETRDGTITLYSDGLMVYEHKGTGFRDVRELEELRRRLNGREGQ